MTPDALSADLREQQALQAGEKCQLAFVGCDIANRALQGKDALGSLEWIEPQAPVDDLQQVVGILTGPDLLRGYEMVFRKPRVGGLRRKSGEAREYRCTGA